MNNVFDQDDARDWAPTSWSAHPSNPAWSAYRVCPEPVPPLTARGCAALTVLLLACVCFWIAVGTEAVRLIDRWLP